MCQCTKFRQNRPNGIGDIAICRFSSWWPSDILYLQNFSPLGKVAEQAIYRVGQKTVPHRLCSLYCICICFSEMAV